MQKIVCNDCIKEMSTMSEKSVDVVITSPPYNLSISYNEYKDNLPLEEYLNWTKEVFINIKRVLKDDGSFFLNVGGTCKEPWRAYQVGHVAAQEFVLQNDIAWIKSISIGNDLSYGHFKPINSERFINQQYEHIFHFTKTGNVKVDKLAVGVAYTDKSNINRWKGKKIDRRCRGNTWFIPYETTQKKKKHPAGFPAKLPEQCIRLHGLRSDLVVLDPFLGAGSTLVACQKLNVQGIGIELDKDYCQMSQEMLENDIV
ncbi:MAG: site-specific DNA-methyltransferase [Crenarchaeota archaeon]|nr:MAG: site-specific DNA-methyltransferase [Thermoproteota archaeon]